MEAAETICVAWLAHMDPDVSMCLAALHAAHKQQQPTGTDDACSVDMACCRLSAWCSISLLQSTKTKLCVSFIKT